ncbi:MULTISPECIES: hypothetical protein [Actinosynnema]|uniref:hypothetical protein n=1 Tax=Actinosynnema TaxID=40566 RepID=UPI0020A5BF34|nr:hypothetical protein [Actinosynnema pretiosum]
MLITIAVRSATLRVAGVAAGCCTSSQRRAIRTLNSQQPGTPASSPPITPITSSLGASWRWA